MAEDFLKQGRFGRAVSYYDMAMTLNRENPLFYLCQGLAMIGTGEYFGAERRITRAIDRFPDSAFADFDFRALVTGSNWPDSRRAELETQLKKKEDVRLRFLLGYLEYYAGSQSAGIKHLERAAAEAPAGSAIARFPALLKER